MVWEHAIRDIPESGLAQERQAVAEELAGVALALELVACTRLLAAYTLKPANDGRYRLTGTLSAQITQTCVVTLDPVESTLEETFDVWFWPPQDLPEPRGGALDIEEEAEPQPIVAGRIDVGAAVFEHLAAAIDPYPRKEGAALDWQGPVDAAEGKPASPFAVLASIKPKA
jgi:uncharacterized metal-binding protein YceD (DUF177 family)